MIIPASTFATVAMPIIQIGLIPVYVDIDKKDLNICVNSIKKAISKKTKIIMPVHTLGNPCNMAEIKKISNYSDISTEICSAWIGNLYNQNINPKSIQRHLSSAKGFFRFLKKNNLVDSSPFELITAPKSPNTWVVNGPIMTVVKSKTLNPSRGKSSDIFETPYNLVSLVKTSSNQ